MITQRQPCATVLVYCTVAGGAGGPSTETATDYLPESLVSFILNGESRGGAPSVQQPVIRLSL